MNENDNNRYKLIALALTLLLVGVTVIVLVTSSLMYSPAGKLADVELKQDTIMFGGEYVMLGDEMDVLDGELAASDASAAEPQTADEPDIDGDDVTNSGAPTQQPADLVADVKESPMKTTPRKEPAPGPSTDKKPAPKPTVKQSTAPQQPQQKTAQSTDKATTNAATDNRVKGAFGTKGGTGGGKQGSTNGNSTEGDRTGRPGLNGLVGYTAERWGRPHSKWTGTVQVRVRINARGTVVEATVVGGSGEAYSKTEVRNSCVQESLKSAFSVPTNTTTEGVGTITWKFV